MISAHTRLAGWRWQRCQVFCGFCYLYPSHRRYRHLIVFVMPWPSRWYLFQRILMLDVLTSIDFLQPFIVQTPLTWPVFAKPCFTARAANTCQHSGVFLPVPGSLRYQYNRDALLAVKSKQTTVSPAVCNRLHELSIHSRHDFPCKKKTGKKRPYRAGRRKTKGRKIPVISSTAFTSVPTCSVNRPSANFDNLIQVPLSSQPQDRQGQLCVALFNACSVGTPEKRTEIADFIIVLCVDVLFFTETWLRQAGDEVKCADLAPPGFTAKSFPRSSRGGGLASYLTSLRPPPFPSFSPDVILCG